LVDAFRHYATRRYGAVRLHLDPPLVVLQGFKDGGQTCLLQQRLAARDDQRVRLVPDLAEPAYLAEKVVRGDFVGFCLLVVLLRVLK
jgi:hypothetical protein